MSSPPANGFNKFMGAVVAFLGLIFSIIGLPGLVEEGFSGAGWIFLALLLSGGLMLFGGIQMIMQAQSDAKHQQAVEAAAKSGQVKTAIPDVMAHWNIDTPTWEAFKINEKKYRTSDNRYFLAAFLIVGTIILMFSRAAPIFIAAPIVLVIGIITITARKSVALKKLIVAPAVPLSVTVGRRQLIMNGVLYHLQSDRISTRKVRLLTEETPMILEFTQYWPTRRGETFDELRIPVPSYAQAEAQKVVDNFFPASPEHHS